MAESGGRSRPERFSAEDGFPDRHVADLGRFGGMKVTVEDRDVGELADFERPQPVLHPDRDGGIDLDRIATDSRTSISVPANRYDSAVQHGDRLGARLRSVPGPDRAVPNQRFHCQIDQPTGTTGRSAIAAATASSGYSRSCIEPLR